MNGDFSKVTKKAKFFIFTVTVAVLLCTLAGCGFFTRSGTDSGTKTSSSKSITINLDLGGGTGVSPKDFISNGKIVDPQTTPTKQGYDFVGWYLDRELTKRATFPDEKSTEIYIYAAWEKRPFTATFVYGGKMPDEVIPAKEGLFEPPKNPKKDGYDFIGWYADAALTTAADENWEATADKRFFAKWKVIKYTISYDCGEHATVSELAEKEFTVEDEIKIRSPRYDQDRYRFLGWYIGDKKVAKIDKGTFGDITLVAKFHSSDNRILSSGFVKVDEDKMQITIGLPFSEDNSIEFAEIMHTVDSKATYEVYPENSQNPTLSVKDLKENEEQKFIVVVKAEDEGECSYNLSVIMHDKSKINVSFIYPDKEDNTTWLEKGTFVTLPAKENIVGYEFVNWYTDEQFTKLFDANSAIYEDTTLHAKYDLIKYDIIYNTGVWELPAGTRNQYTIEDDFLFATPIVNPRNPVSRYEFKGWYDDKGDKIDGISPGRTGNITLYGRYTVEDGYKAVEFDKNAYTYKVDAPQEIFETELDDYFNWCVWNGKTVIPINVLISADKRDADYTYMKGMVTNLFLDSDCSSLINKEYSYNVVSNAVTDGAGQKYDRYNIKIEVLYVDPENSAAEENKYEQLKYDMHGFTSTRGSDFDGFAIESIDDKIEVEKSDQLLYVTMRGYCPSPKKGSAAERIYNKAKVVLRSIVDDGMTDVQKVHAIYDWLILHVAYDHDLLALAGASAEVSSEEAEQFKKYNGFSLEGVFDDGRAVCDGISKAFALMCNIEGIECVKVSGKMVGGQGHAWNKFKIDGKWYNADATSGGVLLRIDLADNTTLGCESLTHRYFMLTDEEMGEMNIPEEGLKGHADKVADTKYSFYQHEEFVYNDTTYNYVIDNEEELRMVAMYMKKADTQTVFDFKLGYSATEEQIKAVIRPILNKSFVLSLDEKSNTIMVWIR